MASDGSGYRGGRWEYPPIGAWGIDFKSGYPKFTRWQRFKMWLRCKLYPPRFVKIKAMSVYGTVAANSAYGKPLYGAGSLANKMLKDLKN